MPPLRISAISFLNTAPLMWDFEQAETAARLREHFELSYTLPSRCAEQLKEGTADIGIIPVAAFTEIPDLAIIPDVAIAAKDRVRSILLISKVPLAKIRSVATDDSSRTSAALVEIFLRKFVGLDPGVIRQKPDMEQMLRWHDAALLIGDPALKAQTKGYYVFDLAAEWRRWTGRPFVFAFWAVRKSALQGLSSEIDVPRIFQQSRDNGLAHIAEIASTWTERLHLPAEMITEYLTQNVDYYLDPDNLEGLRLFFRYGAECKVLPPAPEIHFLAQPKFAAHR